MEGGEARLLAALAHRSCDARSLEKGVLIRGLPRHACRHQNTHAHDAVRSPPPPSLPFVRLSYVCRLCLRPPRDVRRRCRSSIMRRPHMATSATTSAACASRRLPTTRCVRAPHSVRCYTLAAAGAASPGSRERSHGNAYAKCFGSSPLSFGSARLDLMFGGQPHDESARVQSSLE